MMKKPAAVSDVKAVTAAICILCTPPTLLPMPLMAVVPKSVRFSGHGDGGMWREWPASRPEVMRARVRRVSAPAVGHSLNRNGDRLIHSIGKAVEETDRADQRDCGL